jgi:hypothetical protein
LKIEEPPTAIFYSAVSGDSSKMVTKAVALRSRIESSALCSRLSAASSKMVTKAVAVRSLERLAARKTLLNTLNSTTQNVREVRSAVALSPLILKMLHACKVSAKGKVWVVCAPSDQGKTAAAEFIMHGEHGLCPDRSLKIDATNWKDIRVNCAEVLSCPQLAKSLSVHLCRALSSREPADGFMGKVSNWMEHHSCLPSDKMSNWMEHHSCLPSDKVNVDDNRPITLYGPRNARVPVVGSTCKSSPILIIDDFNEATAENEAFVKDLLRDAPKAQAIVFILTRDQEWATTLVALNDGTKIKPLMGNVDNPGYDGSKIFDEVPMWNSMDWSVAQLRELIRPVCKRANLDPDNIVPDGVVWRPTAAFNEVQKQIHGHREFCNQLRKGMS